MLPTTIVSGENKSPPPPPPPAASSSADSSMSYNKSRAAFEASTTPETKTMAETDAALQENFTLAVAEHEAKDDASLAPPSITNNQDHQQPQEDSWQAAPPSPLAASSKENKDASTSTFTTAASTITNTTPTSNSSASSYYTDMSPRRPRRVTSSSDGNQKEQQPTDNGGGNAVNQAGDHGHASDSLPQRPKRVISGELPVMTTSAAYANACSKREFLQSIPDADEPQDESSSPRSGRADQQLTKQTSNNGGDHGSHMGGGQWYAIDSLPQRPTRVVSGDLPVITSSSMRGHGYETQEASSSPRSGRARQQTHDSPANSSGHRRSCIGRRPHRGDSLDSSVSGSNHPPSTKPRVSRQERIRQRSLSNGKGVDGDRETRRRSRAGNHNAPRAMPPKINSAPDVPPRPLGGATSVVDSQHEMKREGHVNRNDSLDARSAPDVPVQPQRRPTVHLVEYQDEIDRELQHNRRPVRYASADAPVIPQRQITNESDTPVPPQRRLTLDSTCDIPVKPQRQATNDSTTADSSGRQQQSSRRNSCLAPPQRKSTMVLPSQNELDREMQAALLERRQHEAEERLQSKMTRAQGNVITDRLKIPRRQVTRDLKSIMDEDQHQQDDCAQQQDDWEDSWWSQEDQVLSLSGHEDSFQDDSICGRRSGEGPGYVRMNSSLSSGMLFVRNHNPNDDDEDGEEVPVDYPLAPPMRRTSTIESSITTPVSSRVTSLSSAAEERGNEPSDNRQGLEPPMQQPICSCSNRSSSICSNTDHNEEFISTDTLPHQPRRSTNDNDDSFWDSRASSIGGSFGGDSFDGDDSSAADQQRRPPAAPKRQSSFETGGPIKSSTTTQQAENALQQQDHQKPAPPSRYSLNSHNDSNLGGFGDRGSRQRGSLSQTIHGSSLKEKADHNTLLSASEHGRQRLPLRRDVRGGVTLKQAAASVNRPGVKAEKIESDPLTEFEQLKWLNETTTMSLEKQLGGYKLSVVDEDAQDLPENDRKLSSTYKFSAAKESEKLKLLQQEAIEEAGQAHTLNLDEQDDLIAKALADVQKIAMLHCGDSDPSILFQASNSSLFGDSSNSHLGGDHGPSGHNVHSLNFGTKVVNASSAAKELEELKHWHNMMVDDKERSAVDLSAAGKELEELKRMMMDGGSQLPLDVIAEDDLVAKALADVEQLAMIPCGDSNPWIQHEASSSSQLGCGSNPRLSSSDD